MKTIQVHSFYTKDETHYNSEDSLCLFRFLFHNCEILEEGVGNFIIKYKDIKFKVVFSENHELTDDDIINILPYSFKGAHSLDKLKHPGIWVPVLVITEKIFPDKLFDTANYSYFGIENEINLYKDFTFYTDQINLNSHEYKNEFILTNTYFYWLRKHNLRLVYEYRNIHANLNHPYKLGYSIYRNDGIRGQIARLLSTNSDCWVSQFNDKNLEDIWEPIENVNITKLHSEVDFDDIIRTKYFFNTQYNYETILDMFFTVLPNFETILIDETHGRTKNSYDSIYLSEKTFIPLLANMPFISTHSYPLECIQKIFNVGPHPFYNEIKDAQGDLDKLITFIEVFLKNYDNNVILLKEYTNTVHNIFIKRLRTENSLLDKIL